MDVVSNENVALFWIQSLSVCRAITFLITELIMFSLALPPVGSVSIIEPEAPGVLLRYAIASQMKLGHYFISDHLFLIRQISIGHTQSLFPDRNQETIQVL